ncbi:LppP/LprE family lipoprotein [Microbacterium sp. NPDC058342]|uniref:LppP/LprE family lipoprotein n=1 Tax=Microbacterium sp. NPDC058342 TaxID=3346454 RepID=UPI003655C569
MRRRQSKLLRGVLALSLIGTLALAGCSGAAETQTTPKPTGAQASPTSSPTSRPVVLPNCDGMNATAQREYEDFGVEMFAEPAGETDLVTFDEVVGPAAQKAMAQAVQHRGCRWPVHSEGTVTEYVAEIAEPDRTPLIEALRADPMVTESVLGDARSFDYESPAPNSYMSATRITHLFVGDVWIAILDHSGQREYAQAALDGVLAVNPSLSGAPGPESSGAGDDRRCSGLTGADALSKWGAGVAGGPWDLSSRYSDVTGYDECAALSWIVLRPEPCCTRFSVTPVLFFHEGEYVPSATVSKYSVDSETPAVRASDGSVALTFMWPGSDSAGPASKATSTYAWDEQSGTVTRVGDLPPS